MIFLKFKEQVYQLLYLIFREYIDIVNLCNAMQWFLIHDANSCLLPELKWHAGFGLQFIELLFLLRETYLFIWNLNQDKF